MDKYLVCVCFSCQGLDEQQSVQILQCYLQEDYRGTRNTLKVTYIAHAHMSDVFT